MDNALDDPDVDSLSEQRYAGVARSHGARLTFAAGLCGYVL